MDKKVVPVETDDDTALDELHWGSPVKTYIYKHK